MWLIASYGLFFRFELLLLKIVENIPNHYLDYILHYSNALVNEIASVNYFYMHILFSNSFMYLCFFDGCILRAEHVYFFHLLMFFLRF